jgi:putative NADPH-quinone reductase
VSDNIGTMARNIVIIDGHPDPEPGRYCHALAEAYAAGAEAGGHSVRRFAIATLDVSFLRSQKDFENGKVPPDIASVQDAIAWGDHLVVIFPLWLGTMPAMLKALFEQVFRPGFAFEAAEGKFPTGRLKGRSARVIVTMGMPAFAYRWVFGAHSLKSFERNILKFVGIKPVRETLFGLVDAASPERRAKWLAQTRALGARAA